MRWTLAKRINSTYLFKGNKNTHYTQEWHILPFWRSCSSLKACFSVSASLFLLIYLLSSSPAGLFYRSLFFTSLSLSLPIALFQTGSCQSSYCMILTVSDCQFLCLSFCSSDTCLAAFPTDSTLCPFLLLFTCFLPVLLHIRLTIVRYNICLCPHLPKKRVCTWVMIHSQLSLWPFLLVTKSVSFIFLFSIPPLPFHIFLHIHRLLSFHPSFLSCSALLFPLTGCSREFCFCSFDLVCFLFVFFCYGTITTTVTVLVLMKIVFLSFFCFVFFFCCCPLCVCVWFFFLFVFYVY